MGQRLNVEIKENEKVLANAYYHWSGYTSSSIYITQKILESIESVNYKNKIVRAIKLLETTGAGLTDGEKIYAETHIKKYDKYNFGECTGRNDGLIAISEKGIKETESWEEARVEIDIKNKKINFKAIWKQTREEIEEDYDMSIEDIPVYDIKFEDIDFNKFTEFSELIIDLISKSTYYIRLKDDETIYSFIE